MEVAVGGLGGAALGSRMMSVHSRRGSRTGTRTGFD